MKIQLEALVKYEKNKKGRSIQTAKATAYIQSRKNGFVKLKNFAKLLHQNIRNKKNLRRLQEKLIFFGRLNSA